MKKLFTIIAFLLMVAVASAQPLGGGGIYGGGGQGVKTAKDCDTAEYYPLGTLCQDTDDGKLYKGTGAAIVEIAAGGGGDVVAASTAQTWGDGTGPVVWTFSVTGTDPTISVATGAFTFNTDLALGANDITMTGSLGATGARVTKGWFTDLEVTNAIAGSVTGNAATATALAADPADCAAGQVATGIAASGDLSCTASLSIATLDMTSATSSIPWVLAADCSTTTTNGHACWDNNGFWLSVGNGAAAVKLYGTTSGSVTSAELLGSLSDETGTGVAVFATSPSFTTSILPVSNADIGSATAEWGDLYLKDGAVIKMGNDQEITMTHVADKGVTIPVLFDESVEASTDNLTAIQLARGVVNNYGQGAADVTLTLPAAAEGLSFVAIVGTAQAANFWRFNGNGAEKIYCDVDGTPASKDYISIAAPTVGARMSCITFQTGSSSYSWLCSKVSGTWTCGDDA